MRNVTCAILGLALALLAPTASAQRINTDRSNRDRPAATPIPDINDLFQLPRAESRILFDQRVVDSYDSRTNFKYSFNVTNPSKQYRDGGLFYLRIRAGLLDETPEQRGAAMLLTRLMATQTQNFSEEEIKERFGQLGVSVGETTIAFAGYNDFIIRFELPEDFVDSREVYIPPAEIVTEMLGGHVLTRERVEQARQELLADFPELPKPQGDEALLTEILPESRLAVRTALNERELVENVAYEDVVEFYRTWFRPDNARLIGIGTFRPGGLMEQVFPRVWEIEPEDELPVSAGAISPLQNELRIEVIPESGRTETEVLLVSLTDPEAPLEINQDLFDETLRERAVAMFAARLAARTQTGSAPWRAATAGSSDVYQAARYTRIRALGRAADWRSMLRQLVTEVRRVELHGFSPEEKTADMQGPLNQRLYAQERAYKDLTTQQRIDQLLSDYRRQSIILEPRPTLETRFKLMRVTSLEELNDAFSQTVDLDRAAIVIRIPADSSTIPDIAEVRSVVQSVIESDPAPASDDEVTPVLLEDIPEGGTIDEIEFDAESGVWSAWLGNNIRIHHRPMPEAEGIFSIHFNIAGGQIEETAQNRGVTDGALLPWSEQRTTRFGPEVFDAIVVGSRLIVDVKRTTDSFGLQARGDVESAETAAQALYLLMNDWELERQFFNGWVDYLKQAVSDTSIRRTADSVINDRWPQVLFDGKVDHLKLATSEQVERRTIEDSRAWLQRLIADGPMEIGMAGDIGYEEAFELARRYFGGLPTRERISSSTLDNLREYDPPSGDLSGTATHDSPLTDTSAIFEGFVGADISTPDDVRALQIAALVMNQDALPRIRDQFELRRMPICFSRESSIYPDYGIFATVGRVPYERRDEVGKAFLAEYERFAVEGPRRSAFEDAKELLYSEAEAASLDPSWWASHLSVADYRGYTYDKPLRDPAAYAAFTREDIRRIFAEYFKNKPRVYVEVNPTDPKPLPDGNTLIGR
ncbi:MAG: insulinase family protein [Planctomycetota bacterium]